jgi:hypothetical protein
MPWHYLTVYRDRGDERYFSLCQVHLDDLGKLDFWLPNPEASPGGEDSISLARALGLMMLDARTWKPVRFEDLKPGMTLQPLLSAAEKQHLKAMVGQFAPQGGA